MADDLTDVQTVFSTYGAFAALRNDGTVVTWGASDPVGIDGVASELTDVQTVFGGYGLCGAEDRRRCGDVGLPLGWG